MQINWGIWGILMKNTLFWGYLSAKKLKSWLKNTFVFSSVAKRGRNEGDPIPRRRMGAKFSEGSGSWYHDPPQSPRPRKILIYLLLFCFFTAVTWGTNSAQNGMSNKGATRRCSALTSERSTAVFQGKTAKIVPEYLSCLSVGATFLHGFFKTNFFYTDFFLHGFLVFFYTNFFLHGKFSEKNKSV